MNQRTRPFVFPLFCVFSHFGFLCLQYFFIVKHVSVLKIETRLNIKKTMNIKQNYNPPRFSETNRFR